MEDDVTISRIGKSFRDQIFVEITEDGNNKVVFACKAESRTSVSGIVIPSYFEWAGTVLRQAEPRRRPRVRFRERSHMRIPGRLPRLRKLAIGPSPRRHLDPREVPVDSFWDSGPLLLRRSEWSRPSR